MTDKFAALVDNFDLDEEFEVSFESIKAEMQAMMVNGSIGTAAELGFESYNAVIEEYRENRSDDRPSMKAAAENFEANEESEEVAEEVLGKVRALIFDALTQNPEVAVLLYSGLKDYAQDHVKVYRDAVLRGYMNESDEDSSDDDFVLRMTREELDSLKTLTESFLSIAEVSDQSVDIPRKQTKTGKQGNPKFASIKGYGEQGTTDTSVTEVRFTYTLDDEEIDAYTLADVALWHVSDAENVYSSSDIAKIVRQQIGNKPQADGWTIEVNGKVLTATPRN